MKRHFKFSGMKKYIATITSIATMFAVSAILSGCNTVSVDANKYVTPDNIDSVIEDTNCIYSTSDSESGSVGVYYSNGTWVTMSNGDLYIIQQYLAPTNKNGTLKDEVSGLPNFSEDDITYKAMSNTSQTVYQLEGETVYTDISTALNTTDFSVFIEWSNGGYYYSYVMQYGDVSVFYTYTDESCLFRSYIQYLESATTIDAAGDSDKNSTESTDDADTTSSDEDEDTVETLEHDALYTTTTTSEEETEAETTSEEEESEDNSEASEE